MISKRTSRLLVVMGIAAGLGIVVLPSRAHAQMATNQSPSTGTRHIISNVDGTGSFYSPQSLEYLYVPQGDAGVRVTLTDETSTTGTGTVSLISISRLTPTGCAAPASIAGFPDNPDTDGVDHTITNPNNNQYVQISNNQTTELVTIGSVTYRVYCVTATTTSLTEVFFRLSTNSGSFLGTYPGPNAYQGTGYANSAAGYSSGTRWDQHIAFSPNCGETGNPFIQLYDLDTYSNAGNTIRLRLRRISKTNPTGPGGDVYLALTGNVYVPTSGTSYTPYTNADMGDAASFYSFPTGPDYLAGPNNVVDSSEDHIPSTASNTRDRPIWQVHINSSTVRFTDDYRYILEVNNIGPANLIRVKLPYDQINASRVCPPTNTAPSGTFSATCAASTGVITVSATVTDAQGGTLTVVANVSGTGAPPSRTQTRTGSGAVAMGTFQRTPGSSYTVSGTVTDSGGLSTAIPNRVVTCPLPPNDASCAQIRYTINGGALQTPVGGVIPARDGDWVVVAMNTRNDGSNAWSNYNAASNPNGYVLAVNTTGDPTTMNEIIRTPPPALVHTLTYVAPAGNVTTGNQAQYNYSFTAPDFDGVTAANNQRDVSYRMYKYGTGSGFFGSNCTWRLSIDRPLPTAVCTISFSPSVIEQGDAFNVTVNIDRRLSDSDEPALTNAANPLNFTPAAGGVSGMPAATANQPYTTVNAGTVGTFTVPGVIKTAMGASSFRAVIYTSSAKTATLTLCPGTISAGNLPYLKSYGGDVWAGGFFPGSSATVNAEINTFAEPEGAGYAGSSAQYGVTALMNINTFYSASLRTAGNGLPPKGLTFANTGAVASPGASTYGGGFGDTAAIAIQDYFATHTNPDPINPANVTQNIGANPIPALVTGPQRFLSSGNRTIPTLPIPNNSQVVLYVDGDVFISGDITYPFPRTSFDELPSFRLIVRGNIYIAPGVRQLDGVYIAQPNSGQAATQGRIYTCAPGVPSISSLYTAATLHAACGNQLAFNGAVVAQQLRLLRTRGTLRDATPTEVPNFNNGAGTNAAEVFNFTPELYLGPGALPATGTAGTYDAIVSLPPIY